MSRRTAGPSSPSIGWTETRSAEAAAAGAAGWSAKTAARAAEKSSSRFIPQHHRRIGKELNQ
jgi:hypothetical protein